jgi:thioredoxin-like negative regulator of GroEL
MHEINSLKEFNEKVKNQDTVILLTASWLDQDQFYRDMISNIDNSIYVVDVSINQDIAIELSIKSFPTLIKYKSGLFDGYLSGIEKEEKIQQFIN